MTGTFTLSVQCALSASHVLPGCPPCDRMHGHTWTVRAHWRFDRLGGDGMGMNFRALKSELRRLVYDRFDHQHLNEIPPFDDMLPTAENLAREVHRILTAGVDTQGRGGLHRVEIWEGPESCVAYEEPESV